MRLRLQGCPQSQSTESVSVARHLLMKTHVDHTFLWVILVLVSITLPGCGWRDHQARRDFIKTYTQAHAAGDLDALLGLYHWEGVDDRQHRMVRQSLFFEQEYPLQRIAIIPLDADDLPDAYANAPGQRPNLPPTARLLLVFDHPERLTSTLLLGKAAGQYRLVNPIPRQAY